MENKYQQIGVQKLATSTVDNRYLLQCNGLYYETGYSVAELVLMLQEYSEEKECISSFVKENCSQSLLLINFLMLFVLYSKSNT